MLHLLTNSNVLTAIARHTTEPLNEKVYIELAKRRKERLARLATHPETHESTAGNVVLWVLPILAGVGVLYAAEHAVALVRPVTGGQYLELLKGAAGDVSARQPIAGAGRGMDDSRRRGHRLPPEAGAGGAAAGPDCGVGAGDRAVSRAAAGADQTGRRHGTSGPSR